MNELARSNTTAAPYYPALDGLRAIAVLMVMACHLLYRPFALGWMGVPLFFALSGFLITGILLRSKDRPGYFSTFYKRRALRIFPIYYLFVLVAFVIGTWQAMPTGDLWRAAIYIQNYRIPGEAQQIPGFFGGHTWSLAVEEQFYVMWPLLVLVLSPKWLLRCCVLLVVGAAVFRAVAFSLSDDDWMLYGWLPSNIDCLAGGAIIAILHHEDRLQPTPLLWLMAAGAVGLALLIFNLSWDDWQQSTTWLTVRTNVLLNTALAILCAAAVGYFALRPIRPLTNRALKHVGRISYGLYLYHVPVYWCVDVLPGYDAVNGYAWSHWVRTPLKIIGTFVVAELSWWLLESRLLKRR